MQQLSYAISLILALSNAVIGFEVGLLLNPNFEPGAGVNRVTLFFSLIFLVVSIFCGVAAVITRLHDFRLTTRVAREKSKSANDEKKIQRDRERASTWGSITWFLFWVQVAVFSIGIFFAVLRVLALAYEKLG